ncbi:MAG: agmatinase [bacterium]|nr:agmatinase [Candidatus Margulisiibacteriota bacterium]
MLPSKRFALLPVPFEATTTYGQGTKKGPAAIIKAFPQVEDFDDELLLDVKDKIKVKSKCSVRRLWSEVRSHLTRGEIPVVLGGEHSITPSVVKVVAGECENLSVLQLDAHADLRNKYQGSKNNHACVMRRVLEICPAVQVGIRNISEEGYEFAKASGQLKKLHFARQKSSLAKIKKQLSQNVYITIDLDVFDPATLPAVGTPEPGGLFWPEIIKILKGVCQAKNVVGFDVVELSPRRGDIVSDFTAAKLVYKLIGCISKFCHGRSSL